MLLALVYVFLNSLTQTKSFHCNVTNNGKTLETFSIVNVQNKCYLFGQEKIPYQSAYYFCGKNKGVLTDVDESFEILIQKTLNESTIIERDYWIGLFWTKIWKKYIWASGTYLNKPERFTNNHFGSCVKFLSSSQTFENVECDDNYAPICLFSFTTADVNQTSSCRNVCEAVQGNYGQSTTALTTTIITINSSLEIENTTTSPLISTTSEGNTTSKTCLCTECDNKHEAGTKTPFIGQEARLPNVTTIAVLAAFLAVSVMANIIAFIMLCRVRRKTQSDIETHKPISMVDILSVDSPSVHQANTNNQETRVGYDIYADPEGESPGYQDVEPKMSGDRKITGGVARGNNVELDPQPYEKLNHDGGHKIRHFSGERHVYGPESAMAATSKNNQDLGIQLRQENAVEALNVYSNYDS